MEKANLTREECRAYIKKHLFSPETPKAMDPIENGIGLVGLELETFPYVKDSQHAFGVRSVGLNDPNQSLLQSLFEITQKYHGQAEFYAGNNADDPGNIHQINFPQGNSFQFEPGGQIEISTTPCGSLEKLQHHLSSMKDLLDLVTSQNGIHFGQAGTNPWFETDDIGNQLQRPRYQALERYLQNISPYGRQMMLQTCSLHVNLDLGNNEATQIKRILLASLLVPFTTAIFAHSSILGGKRTGLASHRGYIWQHLDEKRSGILPLDQISDLFHKDTLLDAYLEFALNAPIIFIPELGNKVLPKNFTFRYWLNNPIEDISPGIDHFQYHLTLLFPEVRIKGYLEMRSVDAPPAEWEMVPAYFYCGLLYDDQTTDKGLDLLLPHAAEIKDLLTESVYGFQSERLYTLSKAVAALSMEGFSRLPNRFRSEKHIHHFNSFFEKYTAQRRSFADDMLDDFSKV